MIKVDREIASREIQENLLFPQKSNDLGFLTEFIGYNVGKILKNNAYKKLQVEYKGKDDPVTHLDRAVENLIKDFYSEYGNFNFVGEEFGEVNNNSNYTIYIDPIDGTKSYINREFNSSVSIGVAKNGNLKHSIVYDFMRGMMYCANSNKRDLTINGSTICDKLPMNGKILLSGKAKSLESKLNQINTISTREQVGSIALSMAQVAAGTYNGMAFYNPGKGSSWDVAAGYHLIAVENDFIITDFFGNPFNFKDPKDGFIAFRKGLPKEISKVFEN